MRIILGLLLVLSLPSLLFSSGIKEIVVPSADDGDIIVKFDEVTQMPISVSDDRAEVTGVNFRVSPKPNQKTKLHWSWNFIVKFKTTIHPTAIKVIDATQKPSIVEINTSTPVLRDDVWVGIMESQPMSRQLFKSMVDEKPWFRLYKFVITYDDNTQSIFHQAVVYRKPARLAILQTAMNYLKASNK